MDISVDDIPFQPMDQICNSLWLCFYSACHFQNWQQLHEFLLLHFLKTLKFTQTQTRLSYRLRILRSWCVQSTNVSVSC